MKKWILVLLVPILLVFNISRVNAETRPQNGVYDPQNYMSQEIKDKLANFNSKNEAQLGIYIVDTLDGKNVEDFARETAREWKIGYDDSNKGALILIAIKDRKFRIETSNQMATELTDSESRAILESVKPLMKKADYNGAVSEIIDKIEKEITPLTDEEKAKLQKTKDDTKATLLTVIAAVGSIFVSMTIVDIYTKKIRLKRSQYDYDGDDRLTPIDNEFIDNETWTTKRTQSFWTKTYLERSQYDYDGPGKLYPNSPNFVKNATWTAALIAAFYAANRLNKNTEQKKNQKHDDDDDDYTSGGLGYGIGGLLSSAFDDDSWSSSSSSSDSSWSSGDWGGGGFDGGGSSSSW